MSAQNDKILDNGAQNYVATVSLFATFDLRELNSSVASSIKMPDKFMP
jgi:hypothetical protein